jgi:hypothetical protein
MAVDDGSDDSGNIAVRFDFVELCPKVGDGVIRRRFEVA